MGDFYSHDWMDDDDWLLSPQEREKHTAKYKARTAAESMRDRQLTKTHLKKYINPELDKMDDDELRLILKVARKIKEYKVFFGMFKEL